MTVDTNKTVDETLPRDLGGVYRLTHTLGEGGMGVVYGGQHLALQRQVAVKMMRLALADKPELKEQALKRFLREARALASVDSPHVVHVHDFGRTEQDDYYLVMDYIEGGSLHDLLRRFGKFPAPLAVHIGIQIAKAIGAAHHTGIIHRDLKPSNVMVTEKSDNAFFVMVLDFGLAKSLQGDDTVLTQTGHTIGTADTMAPEQIKETSAIDHRCDIYSFGVVLYNLVTGKRIFDAPNFTAMCFHHVYEKPVAPLERIPDLEISANFDALIMKCLEKDPKDRFQSMSEAIEALENLVDKKPVSRETIERMPLKEESGILATKSDIGQSDEKHVPQQDEFFDAETMAHEPEDTLKPIDSIAPTARRTVAFFTSSDKPTEKHQMTGPSTVTDQESWSQKGVHQTAVTQENVAMTLAPESPTPQRTWVLPILVLILFGGLGTLIFFQNQQIQSIANQAEKSVPVTNEKPATVQPETKEAVVQPDVEQAAPKKPVQLTGQKKAAAKSKSKQKVATQKVKSKTPKKAKAPKKAEPKKQDVAPPIKTSTPASPFMRQFTNDKKETKKEEKNEFIRVNTN